MSLPDPLSKDSSLQQISHIALILDQSNELPKPCLMSAEDIACATSPSEIETFANYETAHSMLSTLLEYEAKLQRGFENPRKTILWRDQSLDLASRPRPERTPVCSLPIEQTNPSPPQTYLSLKELLGFGSHRPLMIGQFRFSHPLSNAAEFNGALSEIVHITRTAQLEFAVALDYELIAIPFAPNIQWQKDRRKLWYNVKNIQATELGVLSNPLGAFLRVMWMVLQEIVQKTGETPPVKAFEEVNFVPLMGVQGQEGQWNVVAQNVINMTEFFVFGVEERTRRERMPAVEGDEILIIESDV
jgi:hypothetical protein